MPKRRMGARRTVHENHKKVRELEEAIRALQREHEIALEKAFESANRDALTGLPNRKAYDNMLERECKSMLRGGSPVSLIMVDIDFFKKVNDRYGHQAGDTVIKAVASVMKRLTRSSVLVSRIGGEEFALVLPQTTIEDAWVHATRIRRGVESELIAIGGAEEFLKVTVSLGIATWRNEEDTPEVLYKRADAALYASKHAGRNCVSVAD